MSKQISVAESAGRLREAAYHLIDGLNELEQSPSHIMLADVQPGTHTAVEYQALGVTAGGVRRALDTIVNQLDLVESLAATSSRDALEAFTTRFQLPLDAKARTVSLPEAITATRTRLDVLADFVARIDRTWLQNLSRLDAATETLNRLDDEVSALGIVEPLLARTRQRVGELKAVLMNDPLSVSADNEVEIDRLVADAAGHVAQARAGHENLGSDLAQTEVLLAGLRVLRNRAQAALEESAAKITSPANPVMVPAASVLDGPGGLAEQLDEVLRAMEKPQASSQPTWAVQRNQLDRWLSTARRLERQLSEAVDRNTAGLDRREELRGAFGAFEAKMAALGRAEDPELTEIVDRVWNELYTAPSDLDIASEALADLAGALRSTTV